MRDQPLVDMLAETFHHLETGLEEHRQALAYLAAQQTMDYLRQQLHMLQRELRALRGASTILILAFGDPGDDDPWHRTVSDLRRTEPRQFRSPASAIASGNVELYELISYIGAATALTRERRRAVTATILHRLEQSAPEQSGLYRQVSWRVELDPIERQSIRDLLELSEADKDNSYVALRAMLISL